MIREGKHHYYVGLGLFMQLACPSSIGKESACNAGDLGWIPAFLHQEDPSEKEMATHSSILAWRTPWTEESNRLQ